MAKKKTDSGHLKNVTNFKKLHKVCEGLGAKFTPPAEIYTTAALQNMLAVATNKLNAVRILKIEYGAAITYRNKMMEGLADLVLYMITIFELCHLPEADLKNLRQYYNKMKGVRATPIVEEEEVDTEEDDSTPTDGEDEDNEGSFETEDDFVDDDMEESKKKHSVSQMSIEYMLEHFRGAVDFIDIHNPHYTPEEEELQPAALHIKIQDIETAIDSANQAFDMLYDARMDRNVFMNTDNTGMIDVARGVKKYLRRKYKLNSPTYKKVVPLQFTKIGNKKKKKKKAEQS